VNSSVATKQSQDAAEVFQKEVLNTEHLLPNIGTRAVSGGFVTVGAQGAKFVLNLTAAMILARLLTPKEFGLVGMVLGITGLVALFKELGLSTATVQREVITQQQVSNLFWVNVSFSGVLTLICFGLAPLFAKFYHDPRVTGIMMALSLSFVLSGSTVQHLALLNRLMRFRAIAIIEVVSMLLGFASACCLAKLGFGYWSLVAQQLVDSATTLVLTWSTSKWRPSMPKRNSGVRPMLNFGAHLTIADFLGLLMVNSDSILIGRFFGAEPLGLYTRANVLLIRPLRQILIPVNSVLTPVLSRLQSDMERYRRTFVHAYETLALVTFSFAGMCLALSSPLVLVVLGPKWKGVIPLFAVFAVIAVPWPLTEAASWLFQSQGRGREQLVNHTWVGIVTLVSYVVGLYWGTFGLVVTVAITTLLIRLPVVYYFAGRSGPVTSNDLWMVFLSHLPCWGCVYVATKLAHLMVKDAAPIIQLLVCVPVGLGAGTLLMLLFRRPRQSALYAWNTVRSSLVGRWSAATA
jgi:O-antigen/teichoic acid export membrane protein